MNSILNQEKLENYLPLMILLIFLSFTIFLYVSPWKYLAFQGEEHWQTHIALYYKHQSFLIPSPYHGFVTPLTPLYSWINYLAIIVTGWIEVGRLISLLFGVGTLLLLHKICRMWYDKKTGHLAMLLLAISPLFIATSISIKRGTIMLFFSTLSIFFLMKYLKSDESKYLIAIGAALFLSAFAKEVGAFMIIGIGTYLLYKKRFRILKTPGFYIATLMPIILGLLWYFHILSVASSTDLTIPPGQIFSRLFYNLEASLSAVLLNTGIELSVAVPLTTLGLALIGVSSGKSQDRLMLFWLGSGILFYLIFLNGSFIHIHYSTLMLPPLAILAARGAIHLSEKIKNSFEVKRFVSLTLISAILVMIITAGFGFLYLTMLEPNQIYEKEIRQTGNYIQRTAGDNGLIVIDTWAIYYHTTLDIRRIRYLESLESLKEKPKIIAIRVKLPIHLGWTRREKIISENEIQEILSLDKYSISREFTHFVIITKSIHG